MYGCSTDDAASHQRFIGKHKLTVGLLTDADHAVLTKYGAWGTKVMYGKEVEGIIRSTALIAPDGTVAHHWPKVKAEGHAAEVAAKLAELRGSGVQAAKSGGKTPAKGAPQKKSAP